MKESRQSRCAQVLGVIAVLGLAVAPAGAETDLKELARQARGSVVMLEILGARGQALGTGTGFFIDSETLVTNHHVVAPASAVRARLDDERTITVREVMAEDAQSDLAILRAPGADAKGLNLFRGSLVEPGEDVVVLGSPQGLSGTLSTGIVSAWRSPGPDLEWSDIPLIQITAPISPGSSGSPVMNFRGEVLGVAVAVHRTGQNLNFAVPVSEVQRLLARSGSEPERTLNESGSLSTWGVNLGISVLVFGALIVFIRRL